MRLEAYRYDGIGRRAEVVRVTMGLSFDRVSLVFKGEKVEKHYDMALEDWLILVGVIERARCRQFKEQQR